MLKLASLAQPNAGLLKVGSYDGGLCTKFNGTPLVATSEELTE